LLLHRSSLNQIVARFYFKKGTDEQTAKRYLMASRYFDKAIQFDSKYTEAYIENGRVNLTMRKKGGEFGL
jgi:hypothetical protein